MAIHHRCIDIENRKTAGSDNPLALFVWFIAAFATIVIPFGIYTKLFVIGAEYIACRFFIRGTERDMRFWVSYNLSARTYSTSHDDNYVPLQLFCRPIQRIMDDGKPPKKDSIFE